MRDTLRHNQNLINIRLKTPKSDRKAALLLCLFGLKMGLICGSLLELSCFELSKLEADLEVSILELYYGTKSFFCEYEKGSVCGKVAKSSIISIFEFNLIIAMKMIKLILTKDIKDDIIYHR